MDMRVSQVEPITTVIVLLVFQSGMHTPFLTGLESERLGLGQLFLHSRD